MPSANVPVALLIAALAAAAAAGILLYRRGRERRIRALLASRWGAPPDRRITADEFAAIRAQALLLAGPGGFSVDDVTWNDLDMDRLYARVNAACTDAGDHVLYLLLRAPTADGEELARRERVMAWAGREGEGRERLKRILFDLGRTGRMDLEAPFIGNWYSKWRLAGCIALSSGLVLGIVLCVFGFMAALLPTVALALVNTVIALRSMALIGGYMNLIQSLPPVLRAAKRIAGENIPELAEVNGRIGLLLERAGEVLGSGLVAYYNSYSDPGNGMFYLKLLFLSELIGFYRLARGIGRHREEIVEAYALVGRVDALVVAASWRETLGTWCVPELEEGGRSIRFEGIVHPMLENAVPNDLTIGGNVLLTGSNATGKSTFLKAVAVNAVLAQSLHTCAASAWRGGCFRVFTSMALRDNLFGNESYFITEIKSLKRMLDAMGGGVPGLYIVDEVLRGTNTGERIAAASEALRQFCRGNCLVLAATHDIELTHILEALYENMHFTETVRDGGIAFDYTIRPGRSQSRNAIKLLGLLGYGEELVRAANGRLERFEKTGLWVADGE